MPAIVVGIVRNTYKHNPVLSPTSGAIIAGACAASLPVAYALSPDFVAPVVPPMTVIIVVFTLLPHGIRHWVPGTVRSGLVVAALLASLMYISEIGPLYGVSWIVGLLAWVLLYCVARALEWSIRAIWH
jgi:hypothetical protein